MGIRKIGVGLTALGVVATVCLAGAAASTPGPKVSEVGPGIYSVQDLPVAEDGSESEQAVEKINRFKASNADEWTHRQILASATAHSDLGSGAAKDLLKEAFGTQLSDLLVEPFQVLRSAEEIVSFRDDYTAIIDPAGPADRALVVSTSPLRTDGGKLPNLDLKPAGSSIRVKEPTTEVEFSKVPGEGIELPQSELSLAFDDVGAQAPDATVITTDGPGSSRVVFYPNAMEDTDLVAAPLANGVETFAHLRSEHSPEQLKVRIDAPTGGSVSPAEGGGAVISDHDGNQVAQVYPPSALDTAGSTVPVTMSVEDSVLLLEVPHKNRGFAYPILVDPVIETGSWWSGTDTTYPGWTYQNTGDNDYQGALYCFQITLDTCGAPSSGLGLFAYAAPGKQYTQASRSKWKFTPPGNDSYIEEAKLTSWRYMKGGASNGNPFAYWGIASGSTWNDYQITDQGGGGASRVLQGGTNARELSMGLTTNSTMTLPAGTGNWRYNRIAGIQITLGDQNAPSLAPLNLSSVPQGWINNSVSSFPVYFSASDNGLGVLRAATLASRDGGGWYVDDKWQPGCLGTYRSPCPAVTPPNAAINYHPAALPEGQQTVGVFAQDALEKASDPRTFSLKIDRTPPSIELSDQLAEVTEADQSQAQAEEETEELRLPSYRLNVASDDRKGYLSVAGIKKIEVLRNLVPGDFWSFAPIESQTYECGSNCQSQREKTVDIDLVDLDPGKYLVVVRVTDLAGNVGSRSMEFEYNPGTGIRDEYVMQYVPLPDGSEIAVNVANGNLVYHAKDLDQEIGASRLSLERYYNSQLPATESSEWGEGWTLAETPRIDPDPGPADEIDLNGSSGYRANGIELADEGEPALIPDLQAEVTSTDDGFLLQYEGEGEMSFDEEGEMRAVEGEDGSRVEYEFDDGSLQEISAVEPGNPALLEPDKETVADIDVDDGLVKSVAVDSGEELEYAHDEAGRLTEVAGDQDLQYSYGSQGLLNGVVTADGTTVVIEYDSLRRATSVSVTSPDDPPEVDVTSFSYDSNFLTHSKTTVTLQGGREVRYFVNAKGLVIKSQTALQALSLALSGSLKAASVEGALPPGDKSLTINATGGSIFRTLIMIDEAVFEDFECETNCNSIEDTWTVTREELAEGINNIRVYVERQNGDHVSEIFTVYVAPRPPEEEEEGEITPVPTPQEAAQVRTNLGFPALASQTMQNYLDDPDFRAIIEEWGAPFLNPEIAELLERQRFQSEAAELLEGFAASNPNTYAGYSIDEPSGGQITVRFTADGLSHISQLKAQFSRPEMLLLDPVPAGESIAEQVDREEDIVDDIEEGNADDYKVEAILGDSENDSLTIMVEEVTPQMVAGLKNKYGNDVHVVESQLVDEKTPLAAGMIIGTSWGNYCSAANGVRKKFIVDGKPRFKYFVLTANHCGTWDDKPWPDWSHDKKNIWLRGKASGVGRHVGRVYPKNRFPRVDLAAITLNAANARSVPKIIRAKIKRPITGVTWDWWRIEGAKNLCKTGWTTGVTCGRVISPSRKRIYAKFKSQPAIPGQLFKRMALADYDSDYGDSGGVVWDKRTNELVGIHLGRTLKIYGKEYRRFLPLRMANDYFAWDTVISSETPFR